MPENFRGGEKVKTTPIFFMFIAIVEISSVVIVDNAKFLKSFCIGYVKWNEYYACNRYKGLLFDSAMVFANVSYYFCIIIIVIIN